MTQYHKLLWGNSKTDFNKDKFDYGKTGDAVVKFGDAILTATKKKKKVSAEEKRTRDNVAGIFQGAGALISAISPLFGPVAPGFLALGATLSLTGGFFTAAVEEEKAPDPIQQLKDKTEGIIKDVKDLSNRVSGLDTRVTNLDNTVKGLVTSVANLDVEVKNLNVRIGSLETTVTEGFLNLGSQITNLTNYVQGTMKTLGVHVEDLGKRLENIQEDMAIVLRRLESLQIGQMDNFLRKDREDFRTLQREEQYLIQVVKDKATPKVILEHFGPRFQEHLNRYDRLRSNIKVDVEKLVQCTECSGHAGAAMFFHDALAARCHAFDIVFFTMLHKKQSSYTLEHVLRNLKEDLKEYKDLASRWKLEPWLRLPLPHLGEFVQDPELYKQHPDIMQQLDELRKDLESASTDIQLKAVEKMKKLGRAARSAVPDLLQLLSGPTKIGQKHGAQWLCLTADERGYVKTENCDNPNFNAWQWFYWDKGLRLDNNASRYHGKCLGQGMSSGAEPGTKAAVMNPNFGLGSCAQLSGEQDQEAAGFQVGDSLYLRGVGRDVFFGGLGAGLNFDHFWMLRQSEACEAAVGGLEAMGLPEESRSELNALKEKGRQEHQLYGKCAKVASDILSRSQG